MPFSFDSRARGCYDGGVTRRVDYDERQHEVYDAGRSPRPAVRERWRQVLGHHLERAARPTILDLGSGTGAYSDWLAETFDATVIGVEPSARMRAVAERKHAHPRVSYLDGSAEAIPLPDDACDAALLSYVVHHVADRDTCAAELDRVLRPGGSVLVRGTLRESVPGVPWLAYFPEARPLAERQMVSRRELADMFTGRGFELVHSEVVEQENAPSLREFYERVKVRAISTLDLIGDEAFEAGIERMRRAADGETDPEPVVEGVDLVVFRRRP
jgi:ubiquinone/menaquinone biosynthesis C-methylase UbiE